MRRALALGGGLLLAAVLLTSPGFAQEAKEDPSGLAKAIGEYVATFEEDDPKLPDALARFEQRQAELKRSGWKPPWAAYRDVKGREHYEKLSTADLAVECFSSSLLARETMIYEEPRLGVARAAAFHEGFSVLYARPDFWTGMAAVYRHLARRLAETAPENEQARMDILFTLEPLRHLYTYPLLRQKLKGSEDALLEAHLVALKAVLSYARQARDAPGKPFWGARTACGLAGPAMALLKRSDPEAYADLLRRLEGVPVLFRAPQPQQVEAALQMIIPAIERALADRQRKSAGDAKPDAGTAAP